MTKPAVMLPDPERAVRDYLAPLLPQATVGIGVPGNWTPSAPKPHLQVATDGTFLAGWPVAGESTIRLVAWAAGPTTAKALAQHAMGLLLAHTGSDTIARTRPLTGLLPSRDEQTNAETAAVTVRVTLRAVPLPT
jgi:hypothetical protein